MQARRALQRIRAPRRSKICSVPEKSADLLSALFLLLAPLQFWGNTGRCKSEMADRICRKNDDDPRDAAPTAFNSPAPITIRFATGAGHFLIEGRRKLQTAGRGENERWNRRRFQRAKPTRIQPTSWAALSALKMS
jgi:hypothetical protein